MCIRLSVLNHLSRVFASMFWSAVGIQHDVETEARFQKTLPNLVPIRRPREDSRLGALRAFLEFARRSNPLPPEC